MTESQKARLVYVKQRVPRRVGMYERCFTGKASAYYRIKTFCIDCMGINRRLAATCQTDTCPLYGGRPPKWTGGRKKILSGPPSEAQLAVRKRLKPMAKRAQESSKPSTGARTPPAKDDF